MCWSGDVRENLESWLFTILCSWQRCNLYVSDSFHPPPLTSCNRGIEELPRATDWVWAGGDHGLFRDLVPGSGFSKDRGFPKRTAKLRIWWRTWKLHQGNESMVFLPQFSQLNLISGISDYYWPQYHLPGPHWFQFISLLYEINLSETSLLWRAL